MEPLIAILSLPILCLLLTVCVPVAIANARPQTMRQVVTGMIGLALIGALVHFFLHVARGGESISWSLVEVSPAASVDLGMYYDGATSLMLELVSFVGFVVSRFSIRYLEGEATQGRYFRWLGFTVGAVSLMVVAGNLLLFFAAWVMTSWGLHQLLLHYRHRPSAHRAAWTKFAISRLGDTFLIAALILIFQSFGTFELKELFAKVALADADSAFSASHAAIAWLLMLGAVTKSAQFPFHIWLPDTMETPTPVSALMHAGIVNAGGYLVIRMSPLFALAPAALVTLALIGAFTACFASLVMMTQPSVKRALAYSTIAQMGFMMLQCGLGAFSAAMLHIVAHSLYKAYAFLTSGSVVQQAQSLNAAAAPSPSLATSTAALLGAAAASLAAFVTISLAAGVHPYDKPGGMVLAFILLLALTTWGWQSLALGNRKATLVVVAGIAGLCLTYVVSYVLIDRLLRPTTPAIDFPASWNLVAAVIVAAFALLVGFSLTVSRSIRPEWLAPLRVHAANGFYVDALFQRAFASRAKR
jgi:NAD(P)H-quinone oxidoreductase subunit 5